MNNCVKSDIVQHFVTQKQQPMNDKFVDGSVGARVIII